MSDYPPPPRPYWTRPLAVAQLRRVLEEHPAGPERIRAGLALTWLDERCAELERRQREEDVTKEVPTP